MMAALLLIWAALLLGLVKFAIGRVRAGALTLAYFVGLSLIHVPGVLPFAGSALALGDAAETRLGFEMTLAGMAAFVIGAAATATIAMPRLRQHLPALAWRCEGIGWRLLAIGAIGQFVVIPLSFAVPSLTSIASALATLLIVGSWLLLLASVDRRQGWKTAALLGLLPALPLATLVGGGFLGYGVYWVLSIVCFLFVISPRRGWFYAAAPLAALLGLSLFVTYAGQRSAIRELVWIEHAGLLDRLERVSRLVTEFEAFDLDSAAQVTALDDRLNQNRFVGVAMMRYQHGDSELAYGATVPLWALVPRAVWPDKPAVGGGLDVVSRFTGIRFGANTSVGAGQVLEFFVNFGNAGVVIGFFGLGMLLMRLDLGIARALAAGDVGALLVSAMPGLTLLQPGGNVLEILVACAAAYLCARIAVLLRLVDLLGAVRRGPAPA